MSCLKSPGQKYLKNKSSSYIQHDIRRFLEMGFSLLEYYLQSIEFIVNDILSPKHVLKRQNLIE